MSRLLSDLFGDSGGGAGDRMTLGDVVCVEGDCQAGRDARTQMNAVFQQLGQPAQFASSVAAINARFDQLESSNWKYVPFASICCDFKAAGVQAQELMQQMQSSAGQVSTPGNPNLNPGPSQQITDEIADVIKLALVGGVAFVGYRSFTRRSRS